MFLEDSRWIRLQENLPPFPCVGGHKMNASLPDSSFYSAHQGASGAKAPLLAISYVAVKTATHKDFLRSIPQKIIVLACWHKKSATDRVTRRA
jgi:hypothetical protein